MICPGPTPRGRAKHSPRAQTALCLPRRREPLTVDTIVEIVRIPFAHWRKPTPSQARSGVRPLHIHVRHLHKAGQEDSRHSDGRIAPDPPQRVWERLLANTDPVTAVPPLPANGVSPPVCTHARPKPLLSGAFDFADPSRVMHRLFSQKPGQLAPRAAISARPRQPGRDSTTWARHTQAPTL